MKWAGGLTNKQKKTSLESSPLTSAIRVSSHVLRNILYPGFISVAMIKMSQPKAALEKNASVPSSRLLSITDWKSRQEWEAAGCVTPTAKSRDN